MNRNTIVNSVENKSNKHQTETFKITISDKHLNDLESLGQEKILTDYENRKFLNRECLENKHQVVISSLTMEEEISHLEDMTLMGEEVCAICNDFVGLNTLCEIQESPIWILSCPHVFHKECLNQWFQYDKENFTCPLCRESQKYNGKQARVFYRE